MKKGSMQSFKKNPFVKGFFLLLPFPLAFLALILAVVVLFQSFIVPSAYFQFLTHDPISPSVTLPTLPPIVTDDPDDPDDGTTAPEEDAEFPVIPYESQWAILNVEGWERKDIKVYFGDNNSILRKGAGMWFNSRFCGQNGKIVLSAHVTTDFYELETTPIGAIVTMNTVYGVYRYEVTETLIFNYKNAAPLNPADGEEILFMYTCYPRKNGYQFKSERMALICKKIEGKDWVTDE